MQRGVDGLVLLRRGADGAVAFGVVVRTGHYPSLVSVRSTQAGLAPSTQPVAGSIKPLQPAVMRFCGRAVISGHPANRPPPRPEERRVGKEGVSTCKSRG